MGSVTFIQALRKAKKIAHTRGISELLISIQRFMKYRTWAKYLSILNSAKYTTDISGIKVQFQVDNHEQIQRIDNPKSELINRLIDDGERGDTLYDIGACIGVISCTFANAIPDSEIVAFEPVPENFKTLGQNYELNNINYNTYQCALSNDNGRISLTLPKNSAMAGFGNATMSVSDPIIDEKATQTILADKRKGDDLFCDKENISFPNIVTIDAEGAELYIIDGLKQVLRDERCRVLYCEVHNHLIDELEYNISQLESMIESLGFEIERFDKRGTLDGSHEPMLYRIRATKQTDRQNSHSANGTEF